MVRNSYSSGRNDDRLANPNGKNVPQTFAGEGEEGEKLSEVLTCHQYSAVGNMNLNAMLVENIRSHDYFKGLSELTTFDEVVDQIYYDCSYVTPWRPGTHKAQRAAGMCSGLRGVSNAGLPSTAYMLLFKLYCLQLTRGQINRLINHKDSPYIRAIGFLYLRYVCEPKRLFSWLDPFLDDQEPISELGEGGEVTTVGRFVRKLITELEYHDTMLPRLPVPVSREIEKQLSERGGASEATWAHDDDATRDERPPDRAASQATEEDGPPLRSYHDLGSVGAGREHDRAPDRRDHDKRDAERRDRGGDDRRRDERGYPGGGPSGGGYAGATGRGPPAGQERWDDRRGGRPPADWRHDRPRPEGRRPEPPAQSEPKRPRVETMPPPKPEGRAESRPEPGVKEETAAQKLARLRAMQAARSGLHGGRIGGDYASR